MSNPKINAYINTLGKEVNIDYIEFTLKDGREVCLSPDITDYDVYEEGERGVYMTRELFELTDENGDTLTISEIKDAEITGIQMYDGIEGEEIVVVNPDAAALCGIKFTKLVFEDENGDTVSINVPGTVPMKKVKVGCVWTMYGYVEIVVPEGSTPDEILEAAKEQSVDMPLPENGSYLDESFEIDESFFN